MVTTRRIIKDGNIPDPDTDYPMVSHIVWTCTCGLEYMSEITRGSDEVFDSDGDSLDFSCVGCGAYYKKRYKLPDNALEILRTVNANKPLRVGQ
jgi:hypothetical protein